MIFCLNLIFIGYGLRCAGMPQADETMTYLEGMSIIAEGRDDLI